MPSVLSNAPAIFQRPVDYIIQNLEGTSNLMRLRQLMKQLLEARLTINLFKSTSRKSSVVYLGHVVGNGIVHPIKANEGAILALPLGTIRKVLIRLLGMAGFYRRFCNDLFTLVAHLTDVTSSSIPFQWTLTHEKAFEHLKTFLAFSPVVWKSDHFHHFQLQIGFSGVGIDVVFL